MLSRLTIASLTAVASISVLGLVHVNAVSAAGYEPAGIQVAAASNLNNGKKIYAANCASCHGAKGEGGVGPSLRGDLKTPVMKRTKKAVVAWIRDPKPPMPKLYPGTLKAKDVDDVAGYVLATFK
ncbi:c-type cytochrome [bacterium]|nr:MAG: c-type cytochrome [bacterium]